jgi:hypothetical protein
MKIAKQCLLAVILAGVCLTQMGSACNPKKVLADIINCAEPKIAAELPDLAAQAIAAALSQNWMGELWILAQAVGPALGCVEQEIIAALATPPSQPVANMTLTQLRMLLKAKIPAAADQQIIVKRLQAHFDTRYWTK